MNFYIVGNGHTTLVNKKYFKDKHTASFLHELVEHGHHITWLEPVFIERDQQSDLHGNELPTRRFRLLLSDNTKRNALCKLLFFGRAILKSVNEINKVDLVYVFIPSRLSVLIAILAILMRKNYAIYARASFDKNSSVLKCILRRALFVLATGDYFKNIIADYNNNANVVSTMIDLNQEDVYQREITKKISHDILFVGRIHEAKGVWDILEAAKLLIKSGLIFKLHIVGGGAELEKLNSAIVSEGLENNVIVYGLISDTKKLRSLYISSDIFVLPSYVEGVPRVLYEAMTYTLPIVTTMVGSIPSIMVDHVNCIAIPTGNPQAITDAIELLIRNVDLRIKLSRNSQSTIESFYRTKSPLSHAQQLAALAKDTIQ